MSEKNEKSLLQAASLYLWNKRILSTLGLWPENRSDFLFILCAVYYVYHVSTSYITLYLVLGHFLLFTKVLIEVLTYSHISLRIFLLRQHKQAFGVLFKQMRNDFNGKYYSSEKERKAFLRYNLMAKRLIKILVICLALTSTLYYIKPLLIRYFIKRAVRLSNKNVTIPYRLPYGFYKLHKITNVKTYAITYASQFPFAVLSVVIQSAADCLIISMACHLCGRLSALSQRIKAFNGDNDLQTFRAIIHVHQQLLRFGKVMEESLSMLMLCHLLVASTLICIVIFQILIYLTPGKRMNLINIFVLLSANMLRLYFHCWVGECLIQESYGVRAAFYKFKWYNQPLQDRKLVVLSLQRSQFPIRLIAGSFGTFSMSVFTEVMKSAMAYLSFLRNFV